MSTIRKTLEEFIGNVKPFLQIYPDWEECDPIISLRIKGYRYLGHGRGRITFREHGSKWVIKIPFNKHGVTDNSREIKIFKKRKGICYPNNPPRERGRLARCSMVKLFGVNCVKMEYLSHAFNYEIHNGAQWVDDLEDGCQVGLDSKGRLAVFDYGLENLNATKSYSFRLK